MLAQDGAAAFLREQRVDWLGIDADGVCHGSMA
jgi:hypothetical protein